ncbi:hypothetical protein CDAR_554391 [Caerostris darwini]|uniref:MI domain-containing protein n=1 Tax=Caerostris darwini TaxID=1538125 RepID=A0AAV4SMQ9_9ARAC|nr:hypothetical protein CDAR_554391 [Caerostris darwini]
MASDTKSNVLGEFVEKVELGIDVALQNGSLPKTVLENNNILPLDDLLDDRVKRKAKRLSKSVSSEESNVGNVVNVNGSYLRYTKNSRRSRNGFGRGLPKKGGAGGKGTWGKPGIELMAEQEEIISDIHDPNYDFENQDDCEFEAIAPELTPEDLEKTVDPLLHEYFEHGDTHEVIVLGNFIARAVADDCLPPKFVQNYKGKVECEHARAALVHADALLSMKHGLVRLDNVWGVGGGMRPVKYLINQMHLLLKEYLCSGDSAEACRCIQDLEVPHFHHELVYEALIMVIEDMREKNMDLMCSLLQVLAASVIVTPDQMNRGFFRVYEEMPDICIDVPPAYTVLEKFVTKCHTAGFLTEEVIKKMPSRGRKRFVSEGDGGAVKNF